MRIYVLIILYYPGTFNIVIIFFFIPINSKIYSILNLAYVPFHFLLDLAREAWNNKAAGIVSYGSTGGARAAEHLRGILGELMIADVRTHPTLSLFTDFENMTVFKPAERHRQTVNEMLNQLIAWSAALKPLRAKQ